MHTYAKLHLKLEKKPTIHLSFNPNKAMRNKTPQITGVSIRAIQKILDSCSLILFCNGP